MFRHTGENAEDEAPNHVHDEGAEWKVRRREPLNQPGESISRDRSDGPAERNQQDVHSAALIVDCRLQDAHSRIDDC